jgi:hypothetical protein
MSSRPPNFPHENVQNPGKGRSVIVDRAARFFLVQYTKTGKNIPNDRKIYPMATKYTIGP